MTGITKRTYDNFSALENEIECSICNNFDHEDSECRGRFWQKDSEGTSLMCQNMENERTATRKMWYSLICEGQENQWYIDSGCSKHMTGDKEKLQSYRALEKEKKV